MPVTHAVRTGELASDTALCETLPPLCLDLRSVSKDTRLSLATNRRRHCLDDLGAAHARRFHIVGPGASLTQKQCRPQVRARQEYVENRSLQAPTVHGQPPATSPVATSNPLVWIWIIPRITAMTVALLCAAQRQKALGTPLRTPEDTHTDSQTVTEILSQNCVLTQRSAERAQRS